MVDQMGRGLDHSAHAARGTESSFATAEWDQVLVAARFALDPYEASFELASDDVGIELIAHESR